MCTTLLQIEQAIARVKDRCPSQYITAETERGETITIRVSDHPANPRRLSPNDISIVVVTDQEEEEEDDDNGGNWHSGGKKKQFPYATNQHVWEKEGFRENFYSIEDMLEYYEVKI